MFCIAIEAQTEAFDAFIKLCDENSNQENFNLGCCQVQCIAAGRSLGPCMRKLTMQEIFEDANAVDMAGVAEEKKDEALARWFLGRFFFLEYIYFENDFAL